ncbi:hypothetical protein, partial [Xanthomonas sp. BRIP62411]|uniref:hypothetical protein n=1 Tax=Xanthomonas sp. BRIP62411 TaxID=2182389 RepID=UPI0013E0708F
LVLLPNESHAYRARQSILQMLAESEQWLKTHLGEPVKETGATGHDQDNPAPQARLVRDGRYPDSPTSQERACPRWGITGKA